MSVHITRKESEVPFSEIKDGTYFVSGELLFFKVKGCDPIDLEDGSWETFEPDDLVIPVRHVEISYEL